MTEPLSGLARVGAGMDRSQSPNFVRVSPVDEVGPPEGPATWAGFTGDRLWFTDSGISLENGVYAAAVVPGSPAAKEGSLAVGDRIVAVSLQDGLFAARRQVTNSGVVNKT